MSDNLGAKIISGGIWRVVALGFATAVSVTGTAIISRQIGPAGFAQFATSLSLVSIAITLSDFGLLALGLKEFTEREGADRERNIRALIALRLLLSLAAAIGIVAFALISGYPEELVIGLGVAGLGLAALSLQASYLVPLQATFRLGEVAAVDALRQVLVTGLMVAAAVTTGQVGAIIAALFPAGIVVAVVVGFMARGVSPIRPSFDLPEFRRLLSLVSVYALAATIGGMYAFVAQVASDHVLSPHESGEFGLAFRTFAVLVAGGIAAIIGGFPLLVHAAGSDDTERLVYAGRRMLQTSWLAGLTCTVGLVTGATVVADVLGGEEFAGAAPAIALIGLAVPMSFVLYAASSLLLANKIHKELVLVCVFGALASVAATVVLADVHGANGAAIGIVLGESVIAAGYLWILQRTEPRLLPRAGWALLGLLAAAAACLPALMPLPGLVQVTLGLSVFACLALLLRLLPPELLDRLRALRT